jgi:hypothetical protein
MSLIVCEVSVDCQDMSPIILRCLYPDVQYLLQVGVAGSALPTHQCFSHAGSGKVLPMPTSFLTCSTIFSNVFRPTYSYLCTYDLYSLVHNFLDACIRGQVGGETPSHLPR